MGAADICTPVMKEERSTFKELVMDSAELDSTIVSKSASPAHKVAVRPRVQFQMAVALLERIADLTAVMAASLLAYSAYMSLGVGKRLHYSTGTVLTVAILFAATLVVMLDQEGAYKRTNSLLRIRETERLLRVSTRVFGILFAVTFFLSYEYSRWVVLLAAVFVPLLLFLEKQFVFMVVRQLHSRGYGLQNVLLYGAGDTGRQVFSALVSSPKMGLNPVAIVDDNKNLAGQEIFEYGYKRSRSASVIVGPPSSELIRKWDASLVLVGIPSLPAERLNEVASAAFAAGAGVAFVPQLSFGTETSTDYVDLDGVLIASLGHPARNRMYEMGKRAFDFVGALVLMALTLPIGLVLSFLICRDSEGPALFHQTRVGRGGKPFELYKFRSMRVDVPKFGLHPTNAADPRITRVGRWLRRTSLDELPQLLNVLKGDMSLVGPRPEMPFIVESYNARHRQRLTVMPGLTGIWQLSADRAFLIHENIQYDLYYIRHRNLFMDLAILLHTVVFAVKGV
jgi:exopolysaccharide biosynthesis polyprenyl glycosylphosphotransferase